MVAMVCIQLSEQQWSAINKASGLPERARGGIEFLLAYYQAFQQASAKQPRAAHTRNELLRIAKLAERLVVAIIGVKPDAPSAFRTAGVKAHILAALMPPASQPAVGAADMTAVALPRRPGLNTSTRGALTLLYERVLTVEQLRLWFERAARSLPADARGAHKAAENHQWLVGQLDGILAKYTDRKISRSYKDYDLQCFIKLCFAAVDPKVGSGSIKKAIEAHVRLNPRRRTARAPITKRQRA